MLALVFWPDVPSRTPLLSWALTSVQRRKMVSGQPNNSAPARCGKHLTRA